MKRVKVWLAVLLYAVLCACGTTVKTPPLSLTRTKPDFLDEDVKVITTHGTTMTRTISELAERSTLVLMGEVAEIHEPIVIKSAQGARSVHTDVEIAVSEIFRGKAEDSITLRLPGGLLGDEYYTNTDVPNLNLHENYVFFLYRSNKGCGVYTNGGQYYLTGVGQGGVCSG